jgi:predicted AAA+ superfamily ATPase
MYNLSMIKREQYLFKLKQLKNTHLIKVISGVRRSGKSTLLEMFRDELLAQGISQKQITFINFENPEYTDKGIDYMDIYRKINENLVKNQMNYVFLDEIQNVPNFEKLVDGLFIKKNVDLYITGSNAYFLSGELATLLTGRNFEIKILPLSFAEYVSAFKDKSRLDLIFQNYLNYGAFPQTIDLFNIDPSLIREYLLGVYNTVLFKDVIARKGVNDREILEHVAWFLLDNIGSFTTPKSISDYMGSNYRKVAPQTVDNNLSALSDSFLFYPTNRYDIKGKMYLQTQQKYYTIDTGLRSAVLGNQANVDRGHILENIVFLELLRRGGQIWVGRTKDGKEIDFVVKNSKGETEYFQVTESMSNKNTQTRELAPLKSIDDNHFKCIISTDIGSFNYDGIKQVNIIDWLLEN